MFTKDTSFRIGCGRYLQEEGLLARCGSEILRYGKKPMIVGDDTALQVTREIMIPSIAAATAEDAALLAHLMLKVGEIARAEGIEEGGYRTVMNTGENGGQTVPHLHFHVLAGRDMTWPPCSGLPVSPLPLSIGRNAHASQHQRTQFRVGRPAHPGNRTAGNPAPTQFSGAGRRSLPLCHPGRF